MKRFTKLTLYLLFLLSLSSLHAFSFFGRGEVGVLYVPFMSTELQQYSNGNSTKTLIVQATNRIGPDYNLDMDFLWNHVFMNVSMEYSKNYHNLFFDVGTSKDKCDFTLYGNLNHYRCTGIAYSDKVEYNVRELTGSVGGKIAFESNVISDIVNAGASAFFETEHLYEVEMTPTDSSKKTYTIDSKDNCFAVGFDCKSCFFNVVTVGASMTSWQYLDPDATSLIGGFVPIQIRNTFYVKIYHNIGRYFAFCGRLDYFCDHPEVTWGNYKLISRTNQAYFLLHAGLVFKF